MILRRLEDRIREIRQEMVEGNSRYDILLNKEREERLNKVSNERRGTNET